MRDLSATSLTQAQKDMGDALVKIVLTKTDETTRTYGVDTTNRILALRHSEEEWKQSAEVVVDNRDGNLTALTLEGYLGTISYGFGDEYSACAPLEVIAQKTDSMQGELVTSFSLAGIFNLMAEDEASEAYSPDSSNTDTVKTILTAIANKTMDCFSHCKSYTIVFDDEVAEESWWATSLVNTFIPADYFNVNFRESRLSAFKRVLQLTRSKARVNADGYIHVFRPTVGGTTYDYEYNDAIVAANHNFFNKSVRTRLVIPNKVIVSSHPDHDDAYTGNATDSGSYTALARYINQYKYIRATSSSQCELIATAILQHYQMAAEKGHGYAPMNVGQEVFDYVNITDSRADDERAGNIGFLQREYKPGKFNFEFRFGSLLLPGLAGTLPPRGNITTITADTGDLRSLVNTLINAYNSVRDDLDLAMDKQNEIIDYLNARQEVVPKLHVTQRLRIPVGENKYD